MSNDLPYLLRQVSAKLTPEYLNAHDLLSTAADQIGRLERDLDFARGEISEARQSFKDLRNYIKFGTGRLDSETITWLLGNLDMLYLPKLAKEDSS